MNNQVLTELKKKFESEDNFRLKEKKIREELFWKEHGFKTWEELLDYIKTTGKYVYDYNDNFSWDLKTNMVKYNHQVSDGNDCNFWYTNDYYTEKEFLDWKHSVDKSHPDSCRNEYGYIPFYNKFNN